MKLIVARDINNGIGVNNTLPWKCKEDLKWFKKCTEGQTIVMGRNTFESLGLKPLPDRKTVVITSTPHSFKHYVTDSLIFLTLNDYLKDHRKNDDWLVGGASLYKTLLAYVEEAFVTTIIDEYECDTFLDTNFDINFDEMYQYKLCDEATVTRYGRKDNEQV